MFVAREILLIESLSKSSTALSVEEELQHQIVDTQKFLQIMMMMKMMKINLKREKNLFLWRLTHSNGESFR